MGRGARFVAHADDPASMVNEMFILGQEEEPETGRR
jgi:hypothetical protein